MYSEEFVKYLLKYQNDDFKAQKEENKKVFNLNDLSKKKYATVPINTK